MCADGGSLVRGLGGVVGGTGVLELVDGLGASRRGLGSRSVNRVGGWHSGGLVVGSEGLLVPVPLLVTSNLVVLGACERLLSVGELALVLVDGLGGVLDLHLLLLEGTDRLVVLGLRLVELSLELVLLLDTRKREMFGLSA